MKSEKDRKDFLINMYNQLWNSINVHLTVVWQSIGVLVGTFALLAFAEKNVINLDFASLLIILICGWLLAHLIDASYWYNRNLAIITNIEKEFLNKNDVEKIHHYFEEHRPKNKMIYRFKIQFILGIVIWLLILLYHFFKRILPDISFSIKDFEIQLSMPYMASIILILLLYLFHTKRKKHYLLFLNRSPGVDVNRKNNSNCLSQS